MKTLRNAGIGETVKVKRLHGEGALKRRIMDMGITKGTDIYVRKVAPLGEMGYKMKESIYCWDYDDTDNVKKYFRWDMLWNNQGTGYLQKVLKLEKEVLPVYQKALEKWQKKGQVDVKELKKINDKIDDKINKFYQEEFGF